MYDLEILLRVASLLIAAIDLIRRYKNNKRSFQRFIETVVYIASFFKGCLSIFSFVFIGEISIYSISFLKTGNLSISSEIISIFYKGGYKSPDAWWLYTLIITPVIVCLFNVLYRIALDLILNKKNNINRIMGSVFIFLFLIILTYSGCDYLYYFDVHQSFTSSNNSKLGYLDFLYYSLTTFTTTGYGDITPNLPYTKLLLAGSEMLLGVMYSTVILSIFVSRFTYLSSRVDKSNKQKTSANETA